MTVFTTGNPDQPEHTRRYQVKVEDIRKALIVITQEPPHADPAAILKLADDLEAVAKKEGKRLGQDGILTMLAAAADQVEKQIVTGILPATDKDGEDVIKDFRRGYYLLKALIKGE